MNGKELIEAIKFLLENINNIYKITGMAFVSEDDSYLFDCWIKESQFISSDDYEEVDDFIVVKVFKKDNKLFQYKIEP